MVVGRAKNHTEHTAVGGSNRDDRSSQPDTCEELSCINYHGRGALPGEDTKKQCSSRREVTERVRRLQPRPWLSFVPVFERVSKYADMDSIF